MDIAERVLAVCARTAAWGPVECSVLACVSRRLRDRVRSLWAARFRLADLDKYVQGVDDLGGRKRKGPTDGIYRSVAKKEWGLTDDMMDLLECREVKNPHYGRQSAYVYSRWDVRVLWLLARGPGWRPRPRAAPGSGAAKKEAALDRWLERRGIVVERGGEEWRLCMEPYIKGQGTLADVETRRERLKAAAAATLAEVVANATATASPGARFQTVRSQEGQTRESLQRPQTLQRHEELQGKVETEMGRRLWEAFVRGTIPETVYREAVGVLAEAPVIRGCVPGTPYGPERAWSAGSGGCPVVWARAIKERERRYMELEAALRDVGLGVRGDSRLCQEYVAGEEEGEDPDPGGIYWELYEDSEGEDDGPLTLYYVVNTMREMDFLYRHTDYSRRLREEAREYHRGDRNMDWISSIVKDQMGLDRDQRVPADLRAWIAAGRPYERL